MPDIIPLRVAAELCDKSYLSLLRYTKTGYHGVQLKHFTSGGVTCVSIIALNAFLSKIGRRPIPGYRNPLLAELDRHVIPRDGAMVPATALYKKLNHIGWPRSEMIAVLSAVYLRGRRPSDALAVYGNCAWRTDRTEPGARLVLRGEYLYPSRGS